MTVHRTSAAVPVQMGDSSHGGGLHIRKRPSFAFILKAMVGCSVAIIAALDVAAPYVGIDVSGVSKTIVAGFGAATGAVLALRG